VSRRKELGYEIADEGGLQFGLKWAERMIRTGLERGPVLLVLTRPRRTKDQNDKLHPIIRDVAKQVMWHGRWLDEDKWRQLFVANLLSQDSAPGLDGETVFFGPSSRNLPKEVFSDLIELVMAFGSNHGVVWSEKSKRNAEEVRAAA